METGELRRDETVPSTSAPEKDVENGEVEKAATPDGSGWTFVASSSVSGNDVEGATAGVENLHMSSDVTTGSTEGGATANPGSIGAATVNPPNPVIEEAMASLKAMGFTDVGGWLTALVTAHNGDVNTVLDYLHAGAKK
jgi:hypothetical protein